MSNRRLDPSKVAVVRPTDEKILVSVGDAVGGITQTSRSPGPEQPWFESSSISARAATIVMMAAPVELVDEVSVPTVHRFGPYRFYFFAHENRETFELPHVHVRSGDGVAAFWLAPVSLRDYQRYNPREVERIRRIVVANRELLLRHWHDFFDQRS